MLCYIVPVRVFFLCPAQGGKQVFAQEAKPNLKEVPNNAR